jgi:Tfp pilus assembly protein PilW
MFKLMLDRARKQISSLRRDERGVMSLTELLVAIPVMLAVFAATLGLYNLSVHSQTRDEGRTRNLVNEKNGMERMSRDLRTAIAVRYSSQEVLDAQLPSNRWVRYDCSGTTCRRSEGPNQGQFDKGPETVIANVRTADFQLLSNASGAGLQPDYVNPTYMVVTVQVSVNGYQNPIALNDGFNLRNLTTLG